MKKFLFITTALLFCGLFTQAQTSSPDVFASGGGFATGSGFTNSFTVGQGSLPETFAAGTFILTQGFQQPADISSGLAPANDPFAFGVFPNPSSGQIFFEYNLGNASQVVVEVFDVLGQSVYAETSSRTSGHQLQSIDISNQPVGIYFIRFTVKSESSVIERTSKITLTR